MNLSNYPTHKLIHDANVYEGDHIMKNDDIILDIDWELESCIPPLEPPEYDSTGSIITDEVIGYVDGKEIWVSLG